MVVIRFFSTVGTTPIAVANALTSHMLQLEKGAEIHCYFMVGILSSNKPRECSSEEVGKVINLFNMNKRNYSQLEEFNIILHEEDIIEIYEEDLIENVAIIVNHVNRLINDGDRVIFDITGGRKIMTGSALLSMMILWHERKNCSSETAYYWLKMFTHENMGKKLYELGFDAYESVFASVEEINKKVKAIRE
ncbi:MAG: hypothetical protein ACTSRU_15765 [Candidatus Hodarchaeales archaeon]